MKETTVLRSRLAVIFLAVLGAVSAARADTISYFLNQSDRLPDDTNYLKVTLSDLDGGVIKFTVEALAPLLAVAGDSFGIDRFGFNVDPELDFNARSDVFTSSGWAVRTDRRLDGFGWFDVSLTGIGKKNRTDPLEFFISGVDLDTLASYILPSSGKAKNGNSLFAAHVSGIRFGRCGGSNSLGSQTYGHGEPHNCTRQAYFGTDGEVVPAPPAVWLLGTAVAALAGRRALRRKAA
jgi:hypothetical protein